MGRGVGWQEMVQNLIGHLALLNVSLGAGRDGMARSCSPSPAQVRGSLLPWTHQQNPGGWGGRDDTCQVTAVCGSSSALGLFFFTRIFISCHATLQGAPKPTNIHTDGNNPPVGCTETPSPRTGCM